MSSSLAAIPDFFVQACSYREYLVQSVLRDLRNKYKRSVLGYCWTMLHPLAMMTVLAVVFSHIMRVGIKDYAVFLFAGLLPWNYFHSSVMMSLGSIRANARLFSQIPVPKYIFVLSVVFSNLVNYLLAVVPMLLIVLAFGRSIPWTVLLFPVMLLPLFFVVTGVSLLLAASNVFFDDTLHLSEVGLSMLYFMSPVLYGREQLPDWLTQYLIINPLFCQIEFLRGIFYDGTLPSLELYLMSLGAAILLFFVALSAFRRLEDRFLYFI